MSTRVECEEQIEALLLKLVPIVAEIPPDQPVPISREQLERIVVAVNVFPALRGRPRGLLIRLGIELPMGQPARLRSHG